MKVPKMPLSTQNIIILLHFGQLLPTHQMAHTILLIKVIFVIWIIIFIPLGFRNIIQEYRFCYSYLNIVVYSKVIVSSLDILGGPMIRMAI